MKFPAPSIIRFTQRLAAVLAVFLCGAMSTAAWADPPGRVGRLGDTNGQVWLYTPDAGEWISADRNRPLTTGDRLATDANAQAELRIGSTTVRLGAGTELEVLRLDDEAISLQLHNGSIATRLRNAESAREFELRTTEGRFITNRPGRYRFDRGDDTSDVTVWSGEAVYEAPGSALTVYPGQRAEFWLENGSNAQYSITDPVRDSFASWANDRDRRDDRSASTRYVSPEMTGVEDLDRYGSWQQAPDYGAIWVPSYVPAGWAPYGAGHWAWVSPWGWTWVDDMPWGFAPFHYGRWAMFRDRWCWVPGTYVQRPVYAPALVGWIGPHLSISISVGSPAPAVGWFPLAPREVYVPTYRVSPTYVQQVNITHVTNITNITTIVNNPQQAVTQIDFRNRRFPHAVTVVPQTVMVNRQPVAPAAAQLRNTEMVQQIVQQPGQHIVSAPPVATPVITPAIAQQRRMIHGNEAGRAPGLQAVAPSPVVVPPSPPRANGTFGRIAEDVRAKQPPVARAQAAAPQPVSPAPAPQAGPQRAAPAATTRPEPSPHGGAQPQRSVPPPPGRVQTNPAQAMTPAVAPQAEAERMPAPPMARVSPPVPVQHPQQAAPATARVVPPPPMARPAEAQHGHPQPMPVQAMPPQARPQGEVATPARPQQVEPRQRPQEVEQGRRPEGRTPVPQARAPAEQPPRDERHAQRHADPRDQREK
jgi:hypothetical protein